MHRLDPTLLKLSQDKDGNADAIKAREDALAPTYMQVAHEFADLHDAAGRMKAKGVIRDVLSWPKCRTYLYWRTKRRLAEDALKARFKAAAGDELSRPRSPPADSRRARDDKAFLAWAEKLTCLKSPTDRRS
ncbi:acetyl-CoA carboxylase [Aureococcus anophagefferens]|nr:acetyl-CoA carboxylase [Aureococcus anophagefferens]